MFEKKLFKFRCFSEYSISDLNNKTMWFSCANDFNDPFEFQYKLDISIPTEREAVESWLTSKDASPEEVAYVKQAPLEDLIDSAKKLTESTVKNHIAPLSDRFSTRIICLSQGCTDPLMWSHYTDGMKGFVIVYNQFKTLDDNFLPMLPVKYVPAPPTITLDDLKLDSREEAFLLNQKMIGSKHERWAYENEVRFISCPESGHEMLSRIKLRNGGVLDLPENAIHGVIVGEKMPASNLKLLQTICTHNKYKMYKASISLG
ncbi:DUF2971 domain-containing protein [Photobacterium leiognathi]|uniref:DUF2971 domain-containing protein n=1 Tax=Photobacterium leiognathi TaxID=553611 RepID=UPI0029816BD0|nr:DUF2971 domain-containing protein [Photobacterium leiognathi]